MNRELSIIEFADPQPLSDLSRSEPVTDTHQRLYVLTDAESAIHPATAGAGSLKHDLAILPARGPAPTACWRSSRLWNECAAAPFRKYGNIVAGAFTPILAKHSKSFSLEDSISIGIDRMQRNFAPMKAQVETWKERQLSNMSAKLIIYQAFVESDLDAPKHLARKVHDLYFKPQYQDFGPRTLWSLSNAFTSAFKELDPIPQFKATAKLAGFLDSVGMS